MHNDLNKNVAEVFRLAIRRGIVGYSDVLSEVEAIIEQIEDPSADLVEVYNSRGVEDLLYALNDVKGDSSNEMVKIGLMSLLRKRLEDELITAEQVIKSLYQIFIEKELEFTDSEREDILRLDDGYDLANSGIYGDVEEVIMEINEFLLNYSQEGYSQEPYTS